MVSMHTMKACRESGNKAPFILNFGTRLRWLGKLATRSLHPRGRKPRRPLIEGKSRSGRFEEEENLFLRRDTNPGSSIPSPRHSSYEIPGVCREVYKFCNFGISYVTPCRLLLRSLRLTLLWQRLSMLSSLRFVRDAKCFILLSLRYMTLW
jgi:hypothetical protein